MRRLTSSQQQPQLGRASSPRAAYVVACALGVVAATVVAYLVAGGLWYLALALLLVVPGTILVYRYPLSVVVVWLLVQPFVVDVTAGGLLRKLYWVVHRGLPPVAVVIILMAAALGLRRRPLPRLGWAEAMMAGYLIATMISIVYSSDTQLASMYHLYDRVFVPMCLYLIIRLVDPDEGMLRILVPVIAFLVVSQAVFGLLSWLNPEVLPDTWLGRAGERTVGSLSSPSVYTTTLIFGVLILVHRVLNAEDGRVVRWTYLAAAALAGYMVFLSFSRASWIAALIVAAGLVFIYPGFVAKSALVVVAALAIALSTGLLQSQLGTAQDRVASEESALSRLPVVLASVRMFEERPVTGFGFGTFDRYDREFQGPVGDLVIPEKDHASHNLYLTLLAEQGLIGFLLYLGPVLWWMLKAPRAMRNLPRVGFRSHRLLVVLWLVIAAHVFVNNFSNMRSTFGLGMWWITLGLIAVLTVQGSSPTGDSYATGGLRDERGIHDVPLDRE